MKIKLLLPLLIFFSGYAFAQSQGPNSPLTATYSAIGCLACPGAEWDNFTNILSADGANADVGLNAFPNCFQTTCFYSRYLMASNFGFSVPGSAFITGIKAEMLRWSSTVPNIRDSIVQLFTPGNLSTNHANSSSWTAGPLNIIYGDSTDLWGLTLTPDSVNDANFGFRVMIRNIATLPTPGPSYVDHIQMTVYYSISTGTFSQTRTVDELAIVPNPATDQFTMYDARYTISKIEVYNLLGEKVYSQQPQTSNPQPVTVNVSALTPGIYFAVADTGSEKLRQRFIISR